ncbi:3-deoxy-D-manno-octulosonic acid transferase [Candidatus Pelagibacter communis]|uniref:3-deoxy-D-manno-octulosonic acid transferase n=1 Tax=Pelagibacter ubique TaxID=198252 RepID=UPI00094BF62C|nr:3-deoxy-D-manno-octulosonic acid transferase [Candidatus Pelagibacter ubique]
MRIIYNFLVYVVIILSPLIIIYRIFKKKENPKRFFEKFSVNKKKRSKGKLIWFHCSSVGEFLSIVPLIKEFEKITSVKRILVTTSTLSSSKIFEKFKFKKTLHQFYPLDNIYIIKNFLNHWRPSYVIFTESEIWPTMISELKRRKIRVVLINARMSETSFKRWFSIRYFGRSLLEKFDYIYPQNKETFLYFKKLGLEKLKFLGNLKFISYENDKTKEIKNQFFKKKTVLCSASTHNNEEEIFANLHIKYKQKIPNLVTIIIPRHIERVNEIARMLDKKKLRFVKHSEKKKIVNNCDIYLVDSYGESKSFYKISNIVFLGGSLVSKGGQNPLEALRFGCNIVHGDYTFNFKDVYKMLEKEKLSVRVSGSSDLERKAFSLFKKKNNLIKIKKFKKIGNLILKKNFNELKKVII